MCGAIDGAAFHLIRLQFEVYNSDFGTTWNTHFPRKTVTGDPGSSVSFLPDAPRLVTRAHGYSDKIKYDVGNSKKGKYNIYLRILMFWGIRVLICIFICRTNDRALQSRL